MYTIKNYLKLMLAFSVILFASVAVPAAESEVEPLVYPVGEVNIGSNAIHWRPVVEYKSLVLSVSTPDGAVFRKTFGASEAPYLELSDNKGNFLSDGNYTYELRVIPGAGKQIREGNEEIFRSRALTQSGSFEIWKGNFVLPAASEAAGNPGKVQQGEDDISKTMDVCYADDLIVDGSLCVGFDCTCNYSFGFDTIVLKENNLRIFFDDTSVAGSFPRNDWRIIINDSANGGGSYFGVEDSSAGRRIFTLEAGAPSHSLYVDDGGRVGMGTATPSVEVHVVDGDTPTLRLEQDGSSGFAPQTWDVAGNETNFFVRDVTNGSTLPFRIQPDAPSNVLTLRADGKVGIGTWAPGAPLEIETTGQNSAVIFERTDGATGKFTARVNDVFLGSGSDHPVRIVGNNTKVMTIEPGGDVGIGLDDPSYKLEIVGGAYCDGGAWMPGSSREYKENIAGLTLEEAAMALEKLNPVKFNYKTNPKEDYIGFIAEDVPQLVATNTRKSVSPMDVVAVLTKVLQAQQKSMREQQNTISELKKEIDELKKK